MAKERLTKVASIRFSESDWAEIVRAADKEGMDSGEFVRAATLTCMAMLGNRHALKLIGRGAWSRVAALFGRMSKERVVRPEITGT